METSKTKFFSNLVNTDSNNINFVESKTYTYSLDLIEFEICRSLEKPYIDSKIVQLLSNWSKEMCLSFCFKLLDSEIDLIIDYNDFFDTTSEIAFNIFFESYSNEGGINKYVFLSMIIFYFENDIDKVMKKTLKIFCKERENKLNIIELEFFFSCFFRSVIMFILERKFIKCEFKLGDMSEIFKSIYNSQSKMNDNFQYEMKNLLQSFKNLNYTEDKNKENKENKENKVNIENSANSKEIKVVEDNVYVDVDSIISILRNNERVWKILKTINLRCYEGFKEIESKMPKFRN